MSRKAVIILAAVAGVVIVAGGVVAALVFSGGIGVSTEERAQNIVNRLRQVAEQVDYQSVDGGGLSDSLVFRDMVLRFERQSSLSARSVEISEFDWDRPVDKIPYYLDIRLRGVTVDPGGAADQNPDARRFARIFGIGGEDHPADVRYRYRYDPEQQTLELESESDAEGLGSASFFLKLGNVPTLDIDSRNPAVARSLGVTLIRAWVRYSDEAYVEQVLSQIALEENITVEEARQRAIDKLREERTDADSEFAREMIDAAITFLQDPGDFRVEASPPSAVPLFSLLLMGDNADMARERLGVTVTVTPGSQR